MISRLKRFTFLWGALLFVVTLMMIYTMLDTINTYPKSGSVENNIPILESKIARIEKDLETNRDFVKQIRAELTSLLEGGKVEAKNVDAVMKILDKVPQPDDTKAKDTKVKIERKEDTYEVAMYAGASPPEGTCQWVTQAVAEPDINIHNLYEIIPFDNPDGGAWKQGWQVVYDQSRWDSNNPLHVVLVPHTHCDPGWIKTFLDYYQTETKKILDNIVPKLEQDPKYKFMFSEISYFSLWWSEIDSALKGRVKRLIENGQFEISLGGWVMPDEANSHYFAMVDQLIEGHQWLNNTLGFVPQSGWSIDPFGYSSTMAYILKRANFKSMLIQRVHYSIKKHLARKSSLEFMWRQHWDSEANTDIFTHMMPFYSYDVPHTCGPEPAICCQFDFRRLPGSPVRCPWHIDPKAITDANVEERSNTIIDQWKKKATLYKTNVVLVPLGDDFRYMHMEEFNNQFGNYEKIFEYLNNHPELGVKAQFGTLSDYFNKLYEVTGTEPGNRPNGIESLSGDFFSYADRDDHYWTGYFTSRPLQKNLDRTLEHNLRSAEIIFSLALAQARKSAAANFPSTVLMEKLVTARRNLGLFQHHDAITGTAKDNVVVDYGKKLLTAVHNSKRIIAESSAFLLSQSKADYKYDENVLLFDLDEIRSDHDSLPVRPTLMVTDTPKPVIIYNSLAQPRTEVVKLWTNWPYIEVKDSTGQVIHSQVEPYWADMGFIDPGKFKVTFVAEVSGLSVQKYTIRRVASGQDRKNHISEVTYSSGTNVGVKSDIFQVESIDMIDDFELHSSFISATFSGKTGLLKSVKMLSSGDTFKSEVEFITYGTTVNKDKSGAYLFLPDGEARPLMKERPIMVRVINGPIIKEVHVFTQYIQHTVRIHNSPGTDGTCIDMYNIVDIRDTRNKEVGIRIHTDIDNTERVFYSDLNGFQMQKRKYYQKLTLQGNVYPMPTMAYIQDKKRRVSVLTAQSSGVANLVEGAIDVMLDRRLNQDDNRGLGQGVIDNHPTPSRFRLLFETRTGAVKDASEESSFPSLLGQLSSLALIHPMFVMPRSAVGTNPKDLMDSFQLLQQPLPCELHMLNLRALQNSDDNKELQYVPKESSLLLLRHLASDCSFPAPSLTCSAGDGKVSLSDLFSNLPVKKSSITSLTMSKEWTTVPTNTQIQIPPMEITAVKIDF